MSKHDKKSHKKGKRKLTRKERFRYYQKHKYWEGFCSSIENSIHFAEFDFDCDFHPTEKNMPEWIPLFNSFTNGIDYGRYTISDAIRKGLI